MNEFLWSQSVPEEVHWTMDENVPGQEGQEDTVDEEVGVVEVATIAAPLVSQQGCDQGMSQKILLVRLHHNHHWVVLL